MALLDEINTLTIQLERMAKQQKSHTVLTETYLIQAKLSLLTLDMEKARRLLIQAELIAYENQLHDLSMKKDFTQMIL